MLVTTCAHCQSRFRVTPSQLNEKQGQVRCGRCHRVFNGFEALERFPDDDTGTRLLAQREAEARGETAPPVERVGEEDLPEIESVGDPGPIGVDFPLDAPAADRGPPSEAPIEIPSRSAPPAPATPPRDLRESPPPRELRGSPQPRNGRRAVEPELSLLPPPRKKPARAWAFGSALLVLILALEGTFALRTTLAQRYPAMRPTLEALCGYARCTVPWSRQEALLKLEESEMQEVPGKPNEIALGARIRNLATVSQDYPHVELTLTDFTGQPAARRVLRPTDYLGRAVLAGEVLAPGGEVSVQLRLETPRIKATGYELFLFYP
jgi:predicted Zn finger-like uncharacterized protein